MKKILRISIWGLFLLGCTDIGRYESDIESLEEEVAELTLNLSLSEEDREELNSEILKLSDEKKDMEKNYNAYKKRMQPYEDLEKAEAEARKIEAEKKAEENKKEVEKIKAEAEKKKAEEEETRRIKEEQEEAARIAKEEEEERARQAEIAKGYETGITFEQLARTPDDYMGEKIKFSGRVVQVMEGSDEVQLRFAVNDDYDQVIYLAYAPSIVDQRVLEDDYLTIYGYSVGTISYESTLGATITIPAAFIDKIEFN